MATVGNTYMTLADVYRQSANSEEIATVIELLAQTNPILQDAIVQECNDGTKHLTTVRSGLPSVMWRRLYEGVQPSKATTKQIVDSTGMLEAWSEVDAKLVEISPDPKKLRMNEAMAFIEAMNEEMATGIFYHNTKTDPERFLGLSPRFSDLTAENSRQIIDAGGTVSTNTSIWFVVWGERTCHLLYPRGTQAGLKREDKGVQTKDAGSGAVYDVVREKFTWDVGMSLRDWRYVSRVCNIDVASTAFTGGTLDVEGYMIDAYYALQQRKVTNGNAAIYCNTTVKKYLHKRARDKSNVNLTLSDYQGEEVLKFLGIPIRECDALLNTEGRVV
jgi:hypothetical protein